MALSYGACQCGRKFWWTGLRQDIPPCGGCGRRHTSFDFQRLRKRERVTAKPKNDCDKLMDLTDEEIRRGSASIMSSLEGIALRSEKED